MVSPSFYPMIGGVENYVLGMGRELVKLGNDVDVYTPDSVLGKACGPPEDVVQGIRVHRVPVPFEVSYRIKVWPGLMGALQKGSHDLVHVYSHDSYALYALVAARKMKVPLAVTTYGPFEHHSDYDAIRKGAFRLYDAVATPRILGRADAVFVRYPDLAGWAESLGAHAGRIFLEPSGIPKESLVLRAGRGFKQVSGSPIILYLGRISPLKGVQYAVDAMVDVVKAYPGSKLLLIGPDYAGFANHLRERAAKLGVSDSVVLMDPIRSEDEQLEAIASSDVFVMPSSFEGFSQSVIKAMAQGKPVVVTNVGGLPYEVDNGKCGAMCEYADPHGLASGVIRLLSNPDEAASLSKEAKKRARSFTFEALAAGLVEHYERVLN